jgi:C-terminal processing protease CtpA/Prc
VLYVEQPLPPQTDEPSPGERAAQLAKQRRLNGGLETVGRLRGNIGYIEIRKFWRPEFVAPKLPGVMRLVADTDALIVDLRDCGGGAPETVMLFASYLFDRPTHLNDIFWRDENRMEERWTTDVVSGERYGEQRRLYVLTSHETASGCEDLAYALKNAGRATVIGEVTAGAAHAGGPKRLSEHFMMFVPSGRPSSPVTHTDWEGVGVAPDVKSSAKGALVIAQIEALKQLLAVETDGAWKEKLEHTLADLR